MSMNRVLLFDVENNAKTILNFKPIQQGKLNFFDHCAFEKFILKPLREENPGIVLEKEKYDDYLLSKG